LDNAEVIFHAAVPGFGQIFDSQRTFHQRDFQFKAQHNVQVVGGFICFHADQGRFHLVDALEEGFFRYVFQLRREDGF
jgi:hypothetical protein